MSISYCKICNVEYDDFYDAKSHVYTKHDITVFPEANVGYREQ